ncbi:tyrosine-type recombinase/integrase [Aporhodopirellula aestuarii]|uniref:Tyrosine-type recombinase/integrase n=1 Tax=Aporhodopirellula aestuarii TaxID=2950107 RepID=A0ABT0UCA5_9BACT|nr:tyrosine-type recombinase/integrase [Aporhodopirellula aestuarii]MCM2374447.1 tyrosine-type recombinase/integrase [Aporhodopirellula aestuarii]
MPIPKGATFQETLRKIPRGAVIQNGIASWSDRRGVQIGGPVADDGRHAVLREATWTEGNVTRVGAVVPAGDRIILSVDRCYSAKFRNERGKWKRQSTGTSDRDAAKQIAAKWEADAQRRRTGVIDTVLEELAAQAEKPLVEQIDAFIRFRATQGGTEEHRSRTRKHIEEFADAGKWENIANIHADDVTSHVETMSAAGASARTIQGKLQSIKSFTKWLAENHRLRVNPLSMIRKPDPKSDRRHERRMLLPDEWRWLQSSILKLGIERNSMTASERVLLYRTVIQTGLRATEIHQLTRNKMILSNEKPHVLCKASGTKNRKMAKQYIDAGLADDLRNHVATKHPTAPVFSIGSKEELSRTLELDLEGARQAWLDSLNGEERIEAESKDFLLRTNHDGEHLVFHSLRHTCGAWLAMAGEHVKTVQTVMRHGSVTLTMDCYGHIFPGQAENAVGKLAAMMGDHPLGTILGTTATAGPRGVVAG